MTKKKRRSTEGAVESAAERVAEQNGSIGAFRKATESWREERRGYMAIKRACQELQRVGVGDPANLDKFVERVFRSAGVPQ